MPASQPVFSVAGALSKPGVKSRILAELVTPASAASLANKVGLTRQKVNYHLRALEEQQLVHAVEERRRGGLTERLIVASAASYIVSPAVLGRLGADPVHSNDRCRPAISLPGRPASYARSEPSGAVRAKTTSAGRPCRSIR
ncbi:ArsR/SmtB family transcription factor [Labrys sp. La1]|uniref:ArsR/SmtB family transcription factor n=1 Tax=Labrys sp. La1 TaxID=3404917 RepID=UPI003EC0CBDC